jgi:thioredoxin reductase (NADPH)
MISSREGPAQSAADAGPPVILAVDDDAGVLGAIARDLRARFGDDYRIRRAASGEDALRVLRELRLRGACVALIVSDQRMPGMTGIDLLREAAALYPGAKRVLLTAYADNEVAIRGINEIRLDHYLLKPWDPPEDELYPVLTDLLDDWQATRRPAETGIRIVGHAWSAESHELRDFLARNLVPYHWLDLEASAEAVRLLDAVHGGATDGAETGTAAGDAQSGAVRLPLVVFPDGSYLQQPDTAAVALRLGLNTRAAGRVYDLVVVGAGPAGLSAAMYGASEGLSTLLIERDAPGGQAGRSRRIENYLGFPVGLSGGDLARRAVAQARRFGAEILSPIAVTGLRTRDGYHTVELSDGQSVSARALLIAAGVAYRTLDVPGADALSGRGIYYGAALSERAAVEGRDVFVLGGGNAAAQAALFLAGFARSVTLIVRGSTLGAAMSQYLIAQIERTPNISTRLGTSLTAVNGRTRLESINLRDARTGAEEELATTALFIFIGASARTEWLDGILARDPAGYILSGVHLPRDGERPRGWTLRREPLPLETSVPGIFAAGDVRHRAPKGVAAAVGEGTMAVQLIRQYLGGALLRRARPVTAPAPGAPITAPAPEAPVVA